MRHLDFADRLFVTVVAIGLAGVLAIAMLPSESIAQRAATPVFPRGFVVDEAVVTVMMCTGETCAAAGEALVDLGGAAETATAGTYRVTVSGETVWLCSNASACAKTGTLYGVGPGIELQPGVTEYLQIPAGALWARSAGGTGFIRIAKVGL